MLSASRRTVRHSAGLATVLMFLVACGGNPTAIAPLIVHTGVSQDAAEEYRTLTADDDRVEDFLSEHGVSEVHVYPIPEAPEAVLIVALLANPTPLSSWPFETAGDVCAGAPPDPVITAVVWSGEDGVLDIGVAPRFGDLDCYGSIPIPET